jgi:hypothetical protein
MVGVKTGARLLNAAGLAGTLLLGATVFTAASTELGALLTFTAAGGHGVHGRVISSIGVSETAAAGAATPIPATLPFLVSTPAGLGSVVRGAGAAQL